MPPTDSLEDKKEAQLGPCEPIRSIGNAEIIGAEEARNGSYHRSISPRQVHIISLGSNIGSGIFIATGQALANGGPGNMVVAYGLVCLCVWTLLQSLAEMTIAFPVSGNFIDYADRFVDPAVAFGAGLAEWLGWTAVIGAEATFFDILVRYWAGDEFPRAASLSIFLVACMFIFFLPNKWFGWFEYVTSLIKITMFLLIICSSLAVTLGAGPTGHLHTGDTWTRLQPFKNGFSGFANTLLLALWAVSDQVFIGIIAGETRNPRHSMSHAVTLVPFRVNIIYMVSVAFITILVPSDDPRLLSGSGVTASPFVIGIADAGIKILPDIINAGMMTGILAIATESVYVASRILRTMSHQKLLVHHFAAVDSMGRPRLSLAVTCTVAAIFTYINLGASGRVGFNWLLSITNASFFCIWFIIAVTNLRFRQACKAQSSDLLTGRDTYGWVSTLWPMAPVYTLIISTLLFVSCITAGVKPVNGSRFTFANLFQYLIGLIIIVFGTVAYKVFMRSPWRDPKTADLVTGRIRFSSEDLAELDAYYSMPSWRRFLSYIKLW